MTLLRAGQFAGDVLRTAANAPELSVFEVSHIRGPFPRHTHQHARIALLLDGGIVEDADGRVDELKKGEILFWAEGATHEDAFAPSTRSLQIELSHATYGHVAAYFPPPPSPICGDRFEGAAQRLIREIERYDATTSLALQSATYEILARATRLLTDTRPLSFAVNQAMRYAREHLEEHMTLEDLAGAANVSVRRLRERFTAELGAAPMEHVRELRLRRAEDLLRTTELSVSEIAQRCGLDDQAYFGRVFKKRMGMTPGEYRRRG